MGILSIFKKSKQQDINLLTKEEAKPTSIKFNFLPLILMPLLTASVLVAVFFIVFALEQRESSANAELESEIDQQMMEWQKYEDIAKTIYQVKTNIAKYKIITEANTQTKGALVNLRNNIPQAVTLAQLELKDTGAATLAGVSRDPRSIYQFFVVLTNKPEYFSDVKLTSIGYSADQDEDKQKTGEDSDSKKMYRFNMSLTIKDT
jgi:Tfp pilus assembly protein PilN